MSVFYELIAFIIPSDPSSFPHRAVRMKKMVRKIMGSGRAAVLHEDPSVRAAKPLFVRLEKLAVKLTSLANLNRTVHLPTYNKFIGIAALELRDA